MLLFPPPSFSLLALTFVKEVKHCQVGPEVAQVLPPLQVRHVSIHHRHLIRGGE